METDGSLRTQAQPILRKLASCRQRLLDAEDRGMDIEDGGEEEREWNQSLPPIAFEIARETKELVQRIDILDGEQGGDDFS